MLYVRDPDNPNKMIEFHTLSARREAQYKAEQKRKKEQAKKDKIKNVITEFVDNYVPSDSYDEKKVEKLKKNVEKVMIAI